MFANMCIKKLMYLFLFTCIMHHMSANALLDITESAIKTGDELMQAVETNYTYKNLEDVNSKLEYISEVFFNFSKKSYQFKDYLIIKDIFTKFRNVSQEFTNHVGYFISLLTLVNENINFEPHFSKDFEENVRSGKSKKSSDGLLINYISLWNFVFNDRFNESVYHLHILRTAIMENKYNESLLNILNNNTFKVCSNHTSQSRQYILYNILTHIAVVDAKIYTGFQYSMAVFKAWLDAYRLDLLPLRTSIHVSNNLVRMELNINEKMKRYKDEFTTRNLNTLKTFKKSLDHLSRDIWNCYEDTNEDIEYIKMQVFQKFIENEYYLTKKTCEHDCKIIEPTIEKCSDEEYCLRQPKCLGKLKDCSKIHHTLAICGGDIGENKRYTKIINYQGRPRNRNVCKNYIQLNTWLKGLNSCSYCMCNCEIKEKNSYLSLELVTSDVKNNYVVTGVRFQMKNKLLYLEIQQGKLLHNGFIDKRSLDWKTSNYTINANNTSVTEKSQYHEITYEERLMCLDNIEENFINRVVTGVQFVLRNSAIVLAIEYTSFDFSTGKLLMNKKIWMTNGYNPKTRSMMNLQDRIYKVQMNSNKCFKFDSSNLNDGGQDTIPFLSSQLIESTPPAPLAGVGLYILDDKYGNKILNLKISTYNFAPTIHV